jgi:eukaryotic-like serine/threonine-protein kinase
VKDVSLCLDDNGLADLFGGAADDLEREGRCTAIDAHVATCDACRRLVGTYARLFGESPVGGEGDPHAPGAPSLRIPLPGPMVLARAWADAQIGRTVGGRWRLVRVLGIGGSAVVFEASHRNGSRVAIKILRPEHLAVASLMGRFMREAYVANQVDHPGVVRVIDDGSTDEGAPFLVMDLLEGQTLRERVERDGTLSHEAAIDLCAAVLDVLAKAHDRGVVHRDLKPDNLFFDASGAVRVLDFGIARLTTTEGAELTQTGLGMGTSAYMPPEQARGEWEAVGPRSDLWALAATTVFALAKRPPHVASNAQKTLLLAATMNAPSVVSMVPQIRAGLARALDHALAFDPESRPRDARAMAEELLAARADAQPARRSPRRRIAMSILLLVTGAFGAVTVARMWRERGTGTETMSVATPTAAPTGSATTSPATPVIEPSSPVSTPPDGPARPTLRPAVRGPRPIPTPTAATATATDPVALDVPPPPATTASGSAPVPPAPVDSSLMRHRH